jgi:hypothetical protein
MISVRTRIGTYTEWKVKTSKHITQTVAPFGHQLAFELVEVFEKHSTADMNIDELFFALMKIAPNDWPAEELYEQPKAFIDDCRAVLAHMKSNTDLEVEWVKCDLSNVRSWTCSLQLSCATWKRAFEAAIGCEADLAIEVKFDGQRTRVRLPHLPLLEAADMVALHTTADVYWKGPRT